MFSETHGSHAPDTAARGLQLPGAFASMAFDLLRPRPPGKPRRKRRAIDDPLVTTPVWMKTLPTELQILVRDTTTQRVLREGDVLLCRGEVAPGWLGVVSGFLSIEWDEAIVCKPSYGLAQRAWFGEDLLLNEQASACTLVARAPTRVATVPAATFLRLVQDPGFCQVLIQIQSRRLAALRERLAWRHRQGTDARVALVLASVFDCELFFGEVFGIALTQSALARFLGLSRQRTNLALRKLQRQGEIELEYGGLRVRNPRGLAQRAISGDLG